MGCRRVPEQERKIVHLIEVCRCNLPCSAGEVDVVRIVHLAQVVEAARLSHSHTTICSLLTELFSMFGSVQSVHLAQVGCIT
jgi:hypothetical protein